MSIRLAFVLRFESGMEGVDMDDRWLRQTADRIKADIGAKRLQDEKFVEIQRLKREHGPEVWRELKYWLEETCNSLNKEMGSEIVRFSASGNDVTVTGKGEGMYQTMIVTFDPARLIIRYESGGGDPSTTFDIDIKADGKGNLVDQKLRCGKNVADIGKEVISYATQIPRPRY